MKKKMIVRGLYGFPLGMAYGEVIAIVASLLAGQGEYTPCMPQFVAAVGNEVIAAAWQALICGIVGAAFAAASVVWQIEEWSIARQTGIYFLATASVMLPAAYIAGWMEHSVMGALYYLGIFTAAFFVLWLALYLTARYHVKRMNESLDRRQTGGGAD